MPLLISLGTLILGFVVGVALIGTGHVFIGIMLACAAIPIALVAWIKAGERF
jgi:hypothetical protein